MILHKEIRIALVLVAAMFCVALRAQQPQHYATYSLSDDMTSLTHRLVNTSSSSPVSNYALSVSSSYFPSNGLRRMYRAVSFVPYEDGVLYFYMRNGTGSLKVLREKTAPGPMARYLGNQIAGTVGGRALVAGPDFDVVYSRSGSWAAATAVISTPIVAGETYVVVADLTLANSAVAFGMVVASSVPVHIPEEVTPPPVLVNGITYVSLGLPAVGTVGETINFQTRVTNSGTKAFTAAHALSLRLVGSVDAPASVSLNGLAVGASGDAPPWSLTLPSAPGTYTYAFEANESGATFGGIQTATINVQRKSFSVSVTVIGSGSVTGAGSYFDGDYCTLTPTADANHYFSGFSGDQVGGGATLGNASPFITFLVDRDMSVTATFSGKAAQVVTLDNPGTKPSNAPPFSLRWTTNAGTDPAGVIVSGPASINAAELVTLAGTEGPVRARLDFPGNTFYLPASIETTFLVSPPAAGTVLDAHAGGTMLTAAFASPTMSGTDVARDTVGAFVRSSDAALNTIDLTRLQVAGLYDPNAPTGNPGGGDNGGGGDTGGGSSQPPTVTVLPATGTPGEKVTYRDAIWVWTFTGNRFEWVKQ